MMSFELGYRHVDGSVEVMLTGGIHELLFPQLCSQIAQLRELLPGVTLIHHGRQVQEIEYNRDGWKIRGQRIGG